MKRRRLLFMVAVALKDIRVMLDKDSRFVAYGNKVLSYKKNKEDNNGT